MATTQKLGALKKIIDRFSFASSEYAWPTWLPATVLCIPVISLSHFPDGRLMDFSFPT